MLRHAFRRLLLWVPSVLLVMLAVYALAFYGAGDPIKLIDEQWERIASEQLELLEGSQALTHRLVKLPGVSRRRRRLLGPLQSRLYDV